MLGYDKLEPIHSHWIKHIWLSNKDSSIQAFRGSYKTSAIVIVGTIWYLLFNPEARILLVREEGKIAKKVLLAIRQMYKRPPLQRIYREMYGIKNLSFTKETEISITLPLKRRSTPEGNIEVMGLDWSATGNHYDRIHPDDIITIRDRISAPKRELTARFIGESINLIDPGGVRSWSGTPWHKGDGWKLLPTPIKYSIHNLKLSEFTPEVIQKKRTDRGMTTSLFAANYELQHIASEDSLFDDPRYGEWKITGTAQSQLDSKYKGKDTMALTLMYRGEGEDIHGYGKLWTSNVISKYDEIASIWKMNKVGTMHIEYNSDKGLASIELSKKGVLTEDYDENQNKHVKIVGYLHKFWKNIKWAPQTDNEYLNQITDYAEGQEPDDAADSAASCLKRMGFIGVEVIEEDFSVSPDPNYLYENTSY